MLRKNLALMGVFAALCLFSSCNIYAPLASPVSDADYVEEAHKCLHENNFTCAIENYSRISASALRYEKLCTVRLARAGVTLSTMLDIISAGATSGILGQLANALMPYSSTKEAYALAAITDCLQMTAGDTAALLQSLAYLTDCAVRISKTDTLLATSEDGNTTCNSATAGNADGQITAADIGGDVLGDISVGNPGMCETDVQACLDNISAANALGGTLTGAGLSGLANGIAALPPAGATAGGRLGLASSF